MSRLPLVFLLLCALLVLTGCGTSVPDVRGMMAAQAQDSLKAAGFTVGQVNYDVKPTGATGAVVAQEPAAGSRSKSGSPVVLTVAGPPPVAIPAILGLDGPRAEAALVAAGLTVGSVTESYNATVSAGLVVSQVPEAKSEAARGSGVDFDVSKGVAPVAIPAVKGKSQADATELLGAAGFTVKVVKKAAEAKRGTVIAQKPAGGEGQSGSMVTITVSSGLIKVPDVVSASAAYAKKQPENAFFGEDAEQVWDAHDAYIADLLKASGLRSKVELVNGWLLSDSAKAYQTPKAGQMVQPGATVKLVLPVWD